MAVTNFGELPRNVKHLLSVLNGREVQNLWIQKEQARYGDYCFDKQDYYLRDHSLLSPKYQTSISFCPICPVINKIIIWIQERTVNNFSAVNISLTHFCKRKWSAFSSSAQAFISESSIAHFCNSGSYTRLTTWQSESSESAGWQVTKRFTIPSDCNSSCKRMECNRQLNAGSIDRVYFQRSIALHLLGLIFWLAWGMFSATKRASEMALSHVGIVEDKTVSSLKYSRIFVIGQNLSDMQMIGRSIWYIFASVF